MAAHLQVVEPRNENRSVPVRPPNAELRQREYLTAPEVEKLMASARRNGRYGHRDATLILIAFRHGLRAVEIADLEWSQVEFGRNATLHVRRAKNGKPSAHPLRGDEIRALRDLQRRATVGFVFQTERGGPFTSDAVNRLIKRIGERAGIAFPVHAHMLRHGCGYALANAGHDTRAIQDWLGHRSIQHTVRYTELNATRFRDFWR
jgi:integrase